MDRSSKTPAILGLAGSILGLVFASYSTIDYAEHLDRRLHDVHCSFIPGLAAGADQENPCRAAMYSVYSAVMRGNYWGGVPISLFAVGAFSFFVGFSLYILVAGRGASKKALLFYALFGSTPLAVSLVMFFISATQLGSFCKTCVGIYASSALLAVGAWMSYRRAGTETNDGGLAEPLYAHRSPHVAPPPSTTGRPEGGLGWMLVWAAMLAVSALVPALVYVTSLPSELPFLKSCGKLEKTVEAHAALLKMKTSRSVRAVTLFEDPLCPTCKAFHQRIVAEGAFDQLDVQMAMFPLDSECNWMLSNALHPGACVVSKAVICGGDRPREILEWAYDEQEELSQLGKAGEAKLRARISQKWGPQILACMDSSATKVKLNQQLHFAADNSVPVSTPQMYLGDLRVCDEDTDLGLRYTLAQLAPEVVR